MAAIDNRQLEAEKQLEARAKKLRNRIIRKVFRFSDRVSLLLDNGLLATIWAVPRGRLKLQCRVIKKSARRPQSPAFI